jgi:cold shock protein
MSDEMEVFHGQVVWFSGTYGFIEWSKNSVKQNDLFVHYSDITSEGFRTLFKAQKVSFSIGLNKQGAPKAINVKVLTN